MCIGYLEVELRIPACRSLKEKRGVLKKAIALLRSHHNVSIAELDGHNLWQGATLGVVAIYNKRNNVEKTFRRVVTDLESKRDLELINYTIEIL